MNSIQIISTLVAIFVLIGCAYANPISFFTIDCTQNRLLVDGDTISIAEVIKTAHGWAHAQQIDIFGLDKVIFDDDIDKRGQHVNITIFAPTWEIIPTPTNNQSQREILLNTRYRFNFFGTCLTKINGDLLQFKIDGDKKRLKKFNIDGK